MGALDKCLALKRFLFEKLVEQFLRKEKSKEVDVQVGRQGKCHKETRLDFDRVDLWVTKIKKPMIPCARSASRSREQSTKRSSQSENMRKVCLLYSQNNEIV